MDEADALIARIAELHSYDVPAIAVWPIDKLLAAYGDWVEEKRPGNILPVEKRPVLLDFSRLARD